MVTKNLDGTFGLAQLKLSIIVPCRDGQQYLDNCLHSLLRSCECYGGPASDIIGFIVIDDGSEPPLDVSFPVPNLQLVRNQRSVGPAAARERAFGFAESPWVSFVDADCIVTDDYVQRVLKTISTFHEYSVIQGCPTRYVGSSTLGVWEERLYSFMFSRYVAGQTVATTDTRNLVLHRERIGHAAIKLDSPLSFPAAESKVLYERLAQSGVFVAYEPDLTVLHADPVSAKAEAKKKYRHGYGRASLFPIAPSSRALLQRYLEEPSAYAAVPRSYIEEVHSAFLIGWMHGYQARGENENAAVVRQALEGFERRAVIAG